ncbi:acyltransferase family protein [Cupriavidus campinensis]
MKNNNLGDAIVARNTRVESLDLYKGLAILLVVVGHLAQSATPDFDRSLLFKSIYMFHMPLFFLVSGMVYALKQPRLSLGGLGVSIAKRARQLLLPFFAWYLVGYFLSHQQIPFGEYLGRLWKSPDYGLWFLWVLFVFSCVADVGRFLAAVARVPLWAILVVAWAILFRIRTDHSALGIGLIAYQMPFFIAGIFHREILSAASDVFVRTLVVVCTLAFPILAYQWDRVNPPEMGLMLQSAYSLPMPSGTYTLYLAMGYAYQIIPALVGVVVFFVGTKAFTEAGGTNPKLTKPLCFVGQRTLEIYAIHFYMIQFAYFNAGPLMNGLVSLIMAPLLSIAIADYLLKPNKTVALLLFGKSPSAKSV